MSTTHPPSQRSKTGCWTCKVRRKKCLEGGPPCPNCSTANITCLGYGPKPSWKDRGEKEREQAKLLQLRSRRTKSVSIDTSKVAQQLPDTGSSTLTLTTNTEVPLGPEAHSPSGSGTASPSQGNGSDNGPDQHASDQLENLYHMLDSSPSFVYSPEVEGAPIDPNDVLSLLSIPMDISSDNDFYDSSVQWPSSPSPRMSTMNNNSLDLLVKDGTHQDLSFLSSFESSFQVDFREDLRFLEHNFLGFDSVRSLVMSESSTSQNTGTQKHASNPSNHMQVEPTERLRDPDIMVRETELEMQFIGETFNLQHAALRSGSAVKSSWLLLLIKRSSTFYHTSLSMSAYHQFLTLPRDSHDREIAFRDYQNYRSHALRSLSKMVERDYDSISKGERLICSVQLALMEAFSNNIFDCHSHFDCAARILFGAKPQAALSSQSESSMMAQQTLELRGLILWAQPKPFETCRSSRMERQALDFFSVVLIWSEIMSCSTRNMTPSNPEAYRELLAEPDFAQSFFEIVGCEAWVLIAITDTILLDNWKSQQESQGDLSFRELVSRAEEIDTFLQTRIQKLSKSILLSDPASGSLHGTPSERPAIVTNKHMQTYLFAVATMSHLNTIIFGARPLVTDVQKSVQRGVAAWELCLSAMNLRALAWPLCVVGSLAIGPQRDVFRNLLSKAHREHSTIDCVTRLTSVLEECWGKFDARESNKAVPCDWREVMQKLNLNILSL